MKLSDSGQTVFVGTDWRLERVDRFHSLSFGLHPDVRIVFQHLPRNMSGDRHQRLLGNTRFSQSGNRVVPKIMKPKAL